MNIATILLGLLLTLSSAAVSEAELLVCSQPDGSQLYTDQPQAQGYCKKYDPVSQLVFLPPRILAEVPPRDVTYEEQAAVEPEREEQLVPSNAGEDYNPAQNYLSDYDAGFGQQFLPAGGYIYVQQFYGVPRSWPRDGQDFRKKPPPHKDGDHQGKQGGKHEAKHDDPPAPHSAPGNSHVNHREVSGSPLTRFFTDSPQSGPPAGSPQSAPATTSAPAHAHGTSSGAESVTVGQSSAPTASGHDAGERHQGGGSDRK